MSTIETVTEDRESAAPADGADEPLRQPRPAPAPDEPPGHATASAAERRSLLVPVLSTAVGALIAGVLALAALGFNTLRDDMQSMRGEMQSTRGEMQSMRGEMQSIHGEMQSMRGEMQSTRGEMQSMRGEMQSIHGEMQSTRGEMQSIRGEMRQGFARVDERFAQTDARISEINRTLLDHTDRLARIETLHRTHVHAGPQG